ncbi:MAG: hypothetical protein KC441_11650 [Anaerolineales bacterium]|nr:hypothetical protein [Anaerolineales bacterium]
MTRITVTGLALEETAVYPPTKRAQMGRETAVADWRGLSGCWAAVTWFFQTVKKSQSLGR